MGLPHPDPLRTFRPLYLVFAGERPIVWASCCGKCSPNPLRLPVEGCQALLSCAGAGQGDHCPRVDKQLYSHQILPGFCWGKQLAPFVAILQCPEGFGERLWSSLQRAVTNAVGFLGTFQLWLETKQWLDLLLAPASPARGAAGAGLSRQSCFPFPPLAASQRPPSLPTPPGQCPPPSAARFSPRRFKEF